MAAFRFLKACNLPEGGLKVNMGSYLLLNNRSFAAVVISRSLSGGVNKDWG